jgi:hypothetical protein
MAQHDYNIANQTFPAFRTDLNNALTAIQTTNSGTSRPTGAVAGMMWLDTTSATTPTLKFYDGADDISLATINYTANTVDWLDSTISITGLSTTATGTVVTISDTENKTSVNLIIDNQKEVRFRELTANGTNYVGLKAPASLTVDLTYTLPSSAPSANNQALISSTAGVMSFTPYAFPSADGTLNQVLATNGSGALSFSSISGGFSGATENAISSSALTLTSSSTQYQKVQISSLANSYVTLPSATTMSTKGNPVFVIENLSPISAGLDIKNNGGTIIGTISNANTAFITLVDNSTSNGTWQINTVVDQAVADISSTVNSGTATASSLTKVIHLTATKLLVANFVVNSANTGQLLMYTKIGDLSGNTITFGSEQSTTLTSASINYYTWKADVVRLSDTAFILMWGACSDTGGASAIRRISVNTVSGTTVTFGTQNALSFATGNSDLIQGQATAFNGMCCRMSDTKFAVVYNTTTVSGASVPQTAYSGSLTCNIITVSGTTLTVGTKVDLGTSTYTNPTTLVCHDTDKLCVVYYQNTSATNATGRTKVNIISVSGTTPTWGTSVNVESADIANVGSVLAYRYDIWSGNTSLNNMYGIALSTTSVVGIAGGSGTTATGYVLISISGTTPTITLTKNLIIGTSVLSTFVMPPIAINSTTIYQQFYQSNTGVYIYITSSGFRMTNLVSYTANSPSTNNFYNVTTRATSASTAFTTYGLSPYGGGTPYYIATGTFSV